MRLHRTKKIHKAKETTPEVRDGLWSLQKYFSPTHLIRNNVKINVKLQNLNNKKQRVQLYITKQIFFKRKFTNAQWVDENTFNIASYQLWFIIC